jgi:hemolysin III
VTNSLLKRPEGAFYSIAEEIANAVTHGIGAMLAIAGGAVIIVFAALTGDPWKIVSVSIYGATAILLFTMSTLYHALTNAKAKRVFRVFDHSTIFLLIAGTYTPFTLVSLHGSLGWTLFAIVWAAAILGVVLNMINLERFEKFSMLCYVASGWCIVFAFKSLCQCLSWPGVLLLVLGGLMYTGGIFFYNKNDAHFMHSIWHLFVLGGATLHFFCILLYVVLI